MTALSDAYAGTVAAERSRHRLVLGVALFLLGAILVVAGILAAGSGLLTARGVSLGEARWLAGILGGIGVPAVFLGIFTILPANRTTRGTALIGASVAMFGVALFAHAYPCQWIGNTCATDAANLTLPTAGVYFAGTLTTFWCLFIAVANFKTRNDPGGTVTMEIRKMTAPPEESDESSGFGSFGSVGLFGSDPDGDVATQTNTAGASSPAGAAAATSDGGATTQQLSTPGSDTAAQPQSTTEPTTPSTTQTSGSSASRQSATNGQSASASTSTASTADATTASQGGVDQVEPKSSRRSSGGQATATNSAQSGDTGESSIDRYCGSCAQFKYVRTDNGIQPYCAYHDELMDDMESCDSWEPRS